MANIKLTQDTRSRIGRDLRLMKESGLDQKGKSEKWWQQVERFYRNEPPESPGEHLTPFQVPFIQPRIDALTAQVCTVVGKQEPYMLATNVGSAAKQDRKQRFIHTLWQAANFEGQIRKASIMAGVNNSVFYRVTPKKVGAEATGASVAENVMVRAGVQIDVFHPREISVFPASLGGIEGAVWVGHRLYPRVRDVKALQDAGVYYTNVQVVGGQAPDDADETGAYAYGGSFLSAYPGDMDQSQTELWTGCAKIDLSKYSSTFPEGEKWYLVTFAEASGELLMLESYELSRPWYFHSYYIADETLFWSSRSVARNLVSLQDAWNKAHSAIWTASMRASGPPVFGPKLDEKFTTYGFGEYVGTDDPVQPWSPNVHAETQGLVQQCQMFERIGDQVARISQNTTGAVASGSRTATEQSIIAASVATGLEEYIANFSSPFAAMAALTCEIAAADFDSIGMAYWEDAEVPDPETGQPQQIKRPIIEEADLVEPVVWETNGKSPAHTPAMKIQGAQLLVGMSQDPAFGFDKYELATTMLKSGPLSGVDNLQIPKAEFLQQQQEAQQKQEQMMQAELAAKQQQPPHITEFVDAKMYALFTPYEKAQFLKSLGIQADPAHDRNELHPSEAGTNGQSDPAAGPSTLVGQSGGASAQSPADQEALRRIQALLHARASHAAGGPGAGAGEGEAA